MTYSELTSKLVLLEKQTGLYLSDPCVDLENAGSNPSDAKLFDVALCAAEFRAGEAGYDIHKLLLQLTN